METARKNEGHMRLLADTLRRCPSARLRQEAFQSPLKNCFAVAARIRRRRSHPSSMALKSARIARLPLVADVASRAFPASIESGNDSSLLICRIFSTRTGYPLRWKMLYMLAEVDVLRQITLRVAVPCSIIPIAAAAPRERSRLRPGTKGPRSLIRTTTERPVVGLVTCRSVPKGRVRLAAVKPC